MMLEKSFFRIGESDPTLIKTNVKCTFRATQKARKKAVCINLTFFEKTFTCRSRGPVLSRKRKKRGSPEGAQIRILGQEGDDNGSRRHREIISFTSVII